MDVARGLRLDVAFGRVARTLSPRDRGFVHELSYGVSRLRGRIDHLLAERVRGGLDRLDVEVLEILRLGVYQLLYMDGVPAYAAISQSVDQATAASGRGAGGLVNAVLRRVSSDRDGAGRFPDRSRDPAGWMATQGSHPRWLVDRWLARWPEEDVRRLVEANNKQPPLTLVPLDADPTDAVAALEAEGIDARPVGRGTDCVRLGPGTDPARALEVVPGMIQDPAAHLVGRYAEVAHGSKVADLCAAPGGKAVALAGRAAYTVAADRSAVRLRRLRENLERTGRRMGLVVADAAAPPLRPMDAVLLDVPCSGTGTLRRHPDGRWRLDPDTIRALVALQSRLLDGAAEAVAPGGLLIYSTCTLEPEENEEQMAAFLARRPDFRVEPGGSLPREYVDPRGYLYVLPQHTGFDGAFAARLRRSA